MSDRASGIRVKVRRQNLNDGFLICPNDLFRGHGVYTGLEELDRLWLGAGLSCQDDYETTLAEIESWLPSVGRDRHESIRRRLRERGFLSMTRTKIPAGEPRAGKFIWTFEFFMFPLPVEERDVLQPKKTRTPRQGKSPRPGSPGRGDESEQVSESAGGATPGSAGHGGAGHGSPGPAGQGDVYKEEKNHFKKNQDPPQSVRPVTAEIHLVGGEEFPEDTPPTGPSTESSPAEPPNELEAFATWFAANTPWSRQLVADTLVTAVDRRFGDLRRCATVLRNLAEGTYGPTQSPRRLLVANGPWWAPPAPPPKQDRRKGPRCTKPTHEREPAQGCLMCIGEDLGRKDPLPEVTAAQRAAGERAVAERIERLKQIKLQRAAQLVTS